MLRRLNHERFDSENTDISIEVVRMSALAKIEGWVVYIEKTVMLVATATLVIAVFMQVFFRYVIPISTPWTEELSIMSFIFMVMYGSAAAVRYDRHLGITSITARMSKSKFIKAWYAKKILVFLFIAYIMFFKAIPMVMNGLSNTYTIIRIPSFIILVQIPISAFFMLFHIIMSILRKDYEKEYAVQKASLI